MASTWQTVRVFISSTFRDMHAERDYLVKVVFPSLRERLEKYRIHLVDIDLRWGVAEDQSDNDEALDLCLEEISRCQPFFVGILGERYGWVPKSFSDEARSRHGWVQYHTGKSITEMEILHGVLDKRGMHSRALFYFRDPSFISYVPQEIRSDVQAEDAESAEKLAHLKQAIREADLPVPPFEDYPCKFGGLRVNWRLLRAELSDADRQTLEQVASDGIVDLGEYERLPPHVREVVRRHGRVYVVGLHDFGERVHKQLWEAINAEHELPDTPPTATLPQADPLAEEADYHERFMESRLRVYVGRGSLNQQLAEFADDDDEVPCLVTGPSGSGKSAALAKFVTTYRESHPDVLLIPHFIGASPASTSLRQMLRRFCLILREEFQFTDQIEREGQEPETVPADVPEETNQLVSAFRGFLSRVPENRRILLVIDALNQLDETDHAQALGWLPWGPPPHVRIVASCIEEADAQEGVLDQFAAHSHRRVDVLPLTDEERREIVREVPLLSAKTLSPDQVGILLANPTTTNPLFLLVALEELRGFGSYEQLNGRIQAFPRSGDTITALFIQVIQRLEEDFGQPLSHAVLSMLASARRGLSERELEELVSSVDRGQDLFSVLRQLRAYLLNRAELIDFYHRNLYKAARENYLPTAEAQQSAHAQLAGYFSGQDNWLGPPEDQTNVAADLPTTPRPANARKVDELPWQRLQAQQWDPLGEVLCDLTFVEAKCCAGMTFELVRDYDSALDALPEFRDRRAQERRREERMRLYGEELVHYATACRAQVTCKSRLWPVGCHFWLFRWLKQRFIYRSEATSQGEGASLPTPPDSTETQQQMRRAELHGSAIQADEQHVLPSLRLEYFASFVSTHSHLLSNFPAETIPIAHNHARSGPVVDQAEPLAASFRRVWVGRDPRPPVAAAHPLCVRTLEGHTGGVRAVAVTPDGKTAVSAGSDSTLRVWDLASGQTRRTLEGQTSVAVTPDGKTAVSAGDDDALRVWDLTSGQMLRTLKGHTLPVLAVAVTPDGKTAVSASYDNTLRVWDLASGQARRTLKGQTSVAVTPDGKTAVSAGDDNTLRVWDLTSGQTRRTLEGHTSYVTSVSVTPDGKTAVSASCDNTLRVWDLANAQTRRTLEGHTEPVVAVAVTPDAKTAVSASNDSALRVWDLASAQTRHSLEGHTDWVNAVAVTPDGKTAVSASDDNTLRVWDPAGGQTLRTLERHTDDVNAVAVTPDGKTAVSASSDNTLRIWDLGSGQTHRTLEGHTAYVNAVAMTPDGKTAVSASGDCTLRVWDLADGQTFRTLEGHTSSVEAVALTPDGKTAVSASGDYTLRVWDLADGHTFRTLEGHTSSVEGVAVTPDGKTAVSASYDKTLLVWDLSSGRQLAAYVAGAPVYAVSAIGSDGRLACGTQNGQLHFLRIRNLPEDGR